MLFYIKEGFVNFWRNKLVNSLGVITIAIAAMMVLLVFIAYKNITFILTQIQKEITITVYLNDSTTPEQLSLLRSDLSAASEIESFKYYSKADALEDLREKSKDLPELIEGILDNPLPAYFELSMKRINSDIIKDLKGKLRRFDFIESVEYGQKGLNSLFAFKRTILIVFIIISCIILAFAVFIVFNAIQLTVYTRTAEIEIQKLIGATRFYIRLPFIIEALLSVWIATFISVSGAYSTIIKLPGLLPFRLLNEYKPLFLSASEICIFFAVFSLVGVIGSVIALSKFMDFSVDE